MNIYEAFTQLRDVYITMSNDPLYTDIERCVFDQVAFNMSNVLEAYGDDI